MARQISRRTALTAGAGVLGVGAVGTALAAGDSATTSPAARVDTAAPALGTRGMLVGGRVRRAGSSKAADFRWGQAQFGPLQVTRDDVAGALPPTYDASQFPATCTDIISFRTSAGLSARFVNSMVTRITIFQPGPERPILYGGSPTGGTTFKADLAAFRTVVRGFNSSVLVGQAASGLDYRSTRAGEDGSYITGSSADFFTFDAYRAGTDTTDNALVPLQDRPEFTTWFRFVRATGKPWGITEFGAGRCNEAGLVPGIEAIRVSVTRSSADWCRANGAWCFSYLLSDEGPDGHDWLPTDAAFKAMYRDLTRA